MIKVAGIVILIMSGTLIGDMVARDLSLKVRFIEEYMEFIKSVQNEIRYCGNYLEDILKNQNGNGTFHQVLKRCLDYMSEGDSFPCAWEKTFSLSKNSPDSLRKNNLPISKDLSEIIVNFGLKLGTNDVEGQISHCEYNYELAIPHLEKAREEKRTKGKLYRVFGVCISVAIALFLI